MIYLLPQILDRNADRAPDKDAFRCAGKAVTHGGLLSAACALASVLREQGVARGDRVGVFLHKGLRCAQAIYGVMRSGAAYVPLDPHAPTARTERVLRGCGIRHLITEPSLGAEVARLVEAGAPLEHVVGLPADAVKPARSVSWEAVDAGPKTFVPPRQTEQDLAYVMYTSGSTGEPKGIMHTHHSGLCYARLSAATYGLHEGDRLGNHSPLHFDMSTLEYFSGPLVGATTVILPEAYTKLPASLSKLVESERLTIWYSVPFALIQLLERGVLEARDLSSLRWVLFGGEPFPTKHLAALMRRLPGARFSNVYGPAEVNQCTYYHLPRVPADEEAPIPIGQIWDNTDGLILDADDHVVPDGEPGELVVRTPTMMQGYFGRADLNERAFFDVIREGGLRERHYRTGDIVRRQPDGHLMLLGRKDRQIKVRGHRVELDEVEGALVAHPAVEQAAAYGVAGGQGSVSIEAAVIAREGAGVTEAELLRHASSALPWYAVPAQVLFFQDFPRTTSGKIDRTELSRRASQRG